MTENSPEVSPKHKVVTRRTFLMGLSSFIGYIAFHSANGEALEKSSEPNDSWYEYQRPMFEKMHVLEAFALEDRLEQEGRLINLNPVRIGFIDYTGIARISDEFPPVPGYDAANKKPISEDGIYEYVGSNKILLDHATKVASIAISKVNNGVGIAGLCGRIPIIVRQVKFFKDAENVASPALLVDSLNYFTTPDNHVDVLNITTSGEDSKALSDVLERLNKLNTVIVASAGNSSSARPTYPAAYPKVISVGAINLADNAKHQDSNYGKVDIAAYDGVYALFPGEDRISQLTEFTRTSAATPQVSSVAAHLKFLNRSLSPKDVKEIIQSTGTPVAGSYNWRLPNYVEAIKHVVKAV